MIPAALAMTMGLRRPLLEKVQEYLHGRINAELADLKPVTIVPRLKEDESIYRKLQTGKYSALSELRDLVGIKVVMLHRHQVFAAQNIVEGCGLTVVESTYGKSVPPTDFVHREPKLFIMPPGDYLARNPDVDGIIAEVQFTTALQHALDMATHDFDYKGSSYAWENFRLVAQLRGMLELVDTILDDLEKARMPSAATRSKPSAFSNAEVTLAAILDTFPADSLPDDLRRMTDTVAAWIDAARILPKDLAQVLSQHSDLTCALSVDPTSAVLGVILRERGADLLANFSGSFCIGLELASLCREAANVPEARRVAID